MGSRAATAELGEADGLFTKGGRPVKFCFHSSVRQGRRRITEDIERHGGKVVADERETNVLLVDEQENITLIRRRYYSSPELYRMSIFVEPRGFVRHCIATTYYGHLGEPRQGMPGPVPRANVGRVRVTFTSEDRQNLAFYLSTIFPTREGRLGMKEYKHLEQLGQQYDDYEWAKRHTAHSWREHYKKNQEEMDRWITFYAGQLEDHGHHFGQDRRTRDLQPLRQEEEEEEEGEEEQEQADADAVARDYLARNEQNLVAFEEGEQEAPLEEEVGDQEPQRIKRHHFDRRRDAEALHAKRARVAEASSRQKDRTPAERGREESQADDADVDESPDVEGSDLFGDRDYEDRSVYGNIPGVNLPGPLSPEVGSVAENEGPPAPTQDTLVASPDAAEKHVSRQPSKGTEAPTPELTTPSNSQVTLLITQERVAIQGVRGASVQPEASQLRSLVAQAATSAREEAPYRNTRARSRSVEPQPHARQRRDAKGKGKAKANELVPIPEVEKVEDNTQAIQKVAQTTSSAPITTKNNGLAWRDTFEDEMAVEGLLETGDAIELESEDEDNDNNEFPPLPRYQDIEVDDIESEPSDSDDAETHHALELAGKEGSPKDDEDKSDSEREEEEDEDRINQMANRSLTQPTAPSTFNLASRVTRSMAQLAAPVSPRKTRSSRNQTHHREPQFPSPGTKARAMVDRVNEAERNLPYAPPAGSRAARTLRRRG